MKPKNPLNLSLFLFIAFSSPISALDKSSTKCTPWMIGETGQRIMFETLTDGQTLTPEMLTGWKMEEGWPVQTSMGGTPEGILLEGGLSVSTSMGGTPEGFSESECADYEVHVAVDGLLAPVVQSASDEDRRRRERAREMRERRERERERREANRD